MCLTVLFSSALLFLVPFHLTPRQVISDESESKEERKSVSKREEAEKEKEKEKKATSPVSSISLRVVCFCL